MTYLIKQYGLEQGALEIAYIEEFFGEFPGRKGATEIVARLEGREGSILMAEATLPDDPGMLVPVADREEGDRMVAEMNNRGGNNDALRT